MDGKTLRSARVQKGWTQVQLARALAVSQGYVALLEGGSRKVSPRLAHVMVRTLGLPATALPVREESTPSAELAADLANLGYPGFAHLRRGDRAPRNPTSVLFDALRSDSLDPRSAEALPWLVATFQELDWNWLVRRVKVSDLQNRLGFVVALGRQLAERSNAATTSTLREMEESLEQSRLAKEDRLGRPKMTDAERRWLRQNRPGPAAHWNMLSNLTCEHLRDAGVAS
jgi:transcriptional regulator with XRE-family HTH domain